MDTPDLGPIVAECFKAIYSPLGGQTKKRDALSNAEMMLKTLAAHDLRPTQSFDRRRLTVDQRSTTAADLEAIAKQYNEGRAEAKAKGGKSPTSPSGKKGGFSLFGRSK